MAVTITARGSGTSTTDAATTGSFTPAANSVLFVIAGSYRILATPGTPTPSDSLSPDLTYTQRSNFTYTEGFATGRQTTWTAPPGASPSSMTITSTWPQTQSRCGVFVDEAGGADDSTPLQQAVATNTVNNATPTATLASAITDGNGVYMAGFNAGTGTSQTPESGYTGVRYTELAADADGFSIFDDSTTDTTPSTTISSQRWAVTAFEIKVAAAPGGATYPGWYGQRGGWW